MGCRIWEEVKPLRIIKRDDNRTIIDFGRNLSGFVRLSAKGRAGTSIKIKYAETLDENGEVYTKNYWKENYNIFTLRGEGLETWQPTFMYTGFRYVEITGYPGELTENNIRSCFIHSDIKSLSHFECSSEDLNKIYSCAKASILSNRVNFPTDCPGRERRGWTADAFAVSEAESIMFDVLKFYYKYFDDIADCQRGSGWIPVELPVTTSPNVDVLWPCACILIPWDLYMTYGDKDFLKRYYKVMKNFLHFISAISDENHMFDEDKNVTFGDWLADPAASKGFLATSYYYRCVSLFSKITQVLEVKEDAKKYELLAASIKKSFNKRFLKYENERYYYDNNSQSANAHALFFDLVPSELKKNVFESLVDRIEADGTNTNGFLGTMCLLPVLTENGRPELAYRLISSKKYGSWLYMIEKFDLTALGEHYDLSKLDIFSYNHAFLGGSVCSWFYKHLAGILPLKPGYSEICIRPYIPDQIDYVSAKIQTVIGLVESKWIRNSNGEIQMTVKVPPNSMTIVYVPGSYEYITVNDLPAKANKRFELLGFNNGYTSIRIGSGIHFIKTVIVAQK